MRKLLLMLSLILLMLSPEMTAAQQRAIPEKIMNLGYQAQGQPGSRFKRLDLYLPGNTKSSSQHPVVVMIHGGGWTRGDKGGPTVIAPKASWLNNNGFAFASINYRLSPAITHPEHARDCAEAISWIHDNATKFGLDPKRIFVMGHSAGAHLAAVVSVDDRMLMEQGKDLSVIKGTVLLDCAAYDIPRNAEIRGIEKAKKTYVPLFGPQKKWGNASPITHIKRDNGIGPFLVVYSTQRANASGVISKSFADELENNGIPATIVGVDKSHGACSSDVGKPGDILTDQIGTFLRKHALTEVKPGSLPPTGQPEPRTQVQLLENLSYVDDNDPRHRLDLALPPSTPDDTPVPLVICIHGGGWMNGSKEANRGMIRRFADSGYAAATIGYRLTDQAIWPAQLHDCKSAIRWLKSNASRWNIDPNRVAIVGGSAGGHLAAIIGTSSNEPGMEGTLGITEDVDSRPTCVINLYGPTDFLQMDAHAPANAPFKHAARNSPESRLVGGPIGQHPDMVKSANPITWIDATDPPVLIIHGTRDPVVPFHQSILLHDTLKNANVPVVFIRVEGMGHGWARDERIEQRISAFLDMHLRDSNTTMNSDETIGPRSRPGNRRRQRNP